MQLEIEVIQIEWCVRTVDTVTTSMNSSLVLRGHHRRTLTLREGLTLNTWAFLVHAGRVSSTIVCH